MAMHLFSTPVQCTQCGTVVNDPTLDRCPNCSALLKERRTPHRVAGVERRYGSVRVLLGVLRFLGVIIVLIGVMAVLFTSGEMDAMSVGTLVLATLLSAVSLFAIAAMFNVLLDIEENTRASFRTQQMLLEAVQPNRDRGARGAPADPAAAVTEPAS